MELHSTQKVWGIYLSMKIYTKIYASIITMTKELMIMSHKT